MGNQQAAFGTQQVNRDAGQCGNLFGPGTRGIDYLVGFNGKLLAGECVAELYGLNTTTAPKEFFDFGVAEHSAPQAPGLLDVLDGKEVQRFTTTTPNPIGANLNHQFFYIFDTNSKLDKHGLPEQKLELYMKYILSSRNCPPQLKAAIVNTNLEYNYLTDAVRDPAYQPFSFASFTGVFIDMYDHDVGCYLNLFQPLGISIKPAGTTNMIEVSQPEIHDTLHALEPAQPLRSVQEVMGFVSGEGIVEKFAFTPGEFQ